MPINPGAVLNRIYLPYQVRLLGEWFLPCQIGGYVGRYVHRLGVKQAFFPSFVKAGSLLTNVGLNEQ